MKKDLINQAKMIQSMALEHAHPFQEIDSLSEWSDIHGFTDNVLEYLNEPKTDFTTLYSGFILKDIVKNISKNEKSKVKAEQVKSDNAIHSVTTQRHWQAAAKSEHLYKEIVKGYNQMKELDDLTSWSSKLIQDRFKFLSKYPEIMNRYEVFYK